MDFGFSEEQEMLRDAAKRFLADNCPTKFVRQQMADATAHDAGFWKKLVELGWPGLLIPEEYGGQGGSFLDMTVIVEEAGKALVPGPLFTSALLAAPLLIEGGSDQQKKDILPRMAKGEFIGTVAIAEAAGRFDAEGIQLKATKSGKEYTITGEKFFVPDAHVANGMAVAVRTGGSGEKGITILAMNAKAPGITITQLKTVDMTRRLCHVKFDNVKTSEVIGKESEGWPILRRTLDIATAGLAAEMVGTAQKALDMSVDYAKTRVQFGKPIGSFQAVKHKCVDMMVAVENARSLTYYACWTVDTKGAEAATAVPMAKAYASDMAKNVTSEAIQVHGGIGFTWEHDMHLYHRRALAGEANFGNAPVHRETVAKSLLG
ncbi:acyl-CoA dehydrogenase family protein [Candidatus Binatus sp.]|uniref:acyl-CoA dehydrogenase family protein n=1 Tax=Candidatus Binatus sp. TaxID=2811406 RepID=UPI003C64EF7A